MFLARSMWNTCDLWGVFRQLLLVHPLYFVALLASYNALAGLCISSMPHGFTQHSYVAIDSHTLHFLNNMYIYAHTSMLV